MRKTDTKKSADTNTSSNTLKDYTTLMQWVVGSDYISVVKLTDEDNLVVKTQNLGVIKTMRDRLNDKNLVARNVMSATLPLSKSSLSVQPEASTPQADERIFSLSGYDLFNKLFSPSFLELLDIGMVSASCTLPQTETSDNCEISGFSCKDSPVQKVLRFIFVEGDLNALVGTLNRLEFFRTALSNTQLVADILKDKEKAFLKVPKGSKLSEVGKSMFYIPEVRESNAAKFEDSGNYSPTAEFNYGRMLQFLQGQRLLGSESTPPVIAQLTPVDKDGEPITQEIEFSISKNALLDYLHSATESVCIFKDLGKNQLLPIMFRAQDNKVYQTNVHLLLDVSGSMSGCFGDYIDGVQRLVDMIAGKLSDFDIELLTFETSIKSRTFSIKNGVVSELKKAITTQVVWHKTNLYGAMYQSLNGVVGSIGDNQSNHVFLICTDGNDNISEKSCQDVSNLAKSLREKNQQFALYSSGWGQCNHEFFKTIANGCGFTHLKVQDANGLSALENCVGSLNKSKIIAEILWSTGSTHIQCPAGEIKVAETAVGRDPIVKLGKDEYKVGMQKN